MNKNIELTWENINFLLENRNEQDSFYIKLSYEQLDEEFFLYVRAYLDKSDSEPTLATTTKENSFNDIKKDINDLLTSFQQYLGSIPKAKVIPVDGANIIRYATTNKDGLNITLDTYMPTESKKVR